MSDKTYKIGKHSFSLRDLSYREDQRLGRYIGKIKSNVPVQMNFASEAALITGGFLAVLISSKIGAKILALVLEETTGNFLLRCKILRRFYLARNIKRAVTGEVLTDFFTDAALSTSMLVNHLMRLLSERIALLMESNVSLGGLTEQSRTSATQPG